MDALTLAEIIYLETLVLDGLPIGTDSNSVWSLCAAFRLRTISGRVSGDNLLPVIYFNSALLHGGSQQVESLVILWRMYNVNQYIFD